MPTPSNLPRLYDEKEVSRLLERATELQRQEPMRAAGGGGLSLDELADIAAEAGIDPRYLRRAALELDGGAGGDTRRSWFAGEQTVLLREEVIPGELPESGFERLVAVIQMVAHEHGQPSLLGHTLTWQAETTNKTRSLQVLVSVRDGETRIRVEERLAHLAGAAFGISMGVVGPTLGVAVGLPIALEVLGSAILAVGFPVGAVALSYMAGREIFRRAVRRRRSAVAELIDQLSREAEACIAEAAEEGAERPLELPRD